MQTEVKRKLKQYIKNGQTDLALTLLNGIDTRPTRTPAQNSSLHLWFNLIEREAENQRVTWDMVVRHTSHLKITSEGLKSACKQLIQALWGYTSTTQLKKTGDMDVVIEHMTDWLSKEMEVPPFPNKSDKPNKLDNIEMARTVQYNNNYQKPTI